MSTAGALGVATPPPEAPDNGAGEPMVSVRGLTKRFRVRRPWQAVLRQPLARRRQLTVDRMSFDVAPGEFFGLLGPNGAGKTTLLKMLATFILPDEGRATVDGFDVAAQSAAVRSRVAPIIANERSLYWRLTAAENLELFAHLVRVPPNEIASRVDEVLEVVGLARTGRKMVGQFSSGLMQRLLIARALLGRPRVLLLDEPTRSLDPVSAREFRRFLRDEVAARRRCAVIVATHNPDEALELCTRVGIVHHGRLLAVGTTGEITQRLFGNRYVLWTALPDHPALRDLAAEPASNRHESTGRWTPLTVRIEGDGDQGAAVLERLVRSGVPIARFERAVVSLPDLIEGVVHAQPDDQAS
ncbi:MAG: ABC transporter ATP-binding protein [Gemmatimonadaceae bacterium]